MYAIRSYYAREYASVQFREAVSLKNFRNIINEDYSFLLESPKISFNTCIERYKVIYIQVALTAQKVTVLDYRLIRDQEGLGIDAALITAKSVEVEARITSYNVCYTKLLRQRKCSQNVRTFQNLVP